MKGLGISKKKTKKEKKMGACSSSSSSSDGNVIIPLPPTPPLEVESLVERRHRLRSSSCPAVSRPPTPIPGFHY
jgi:hypothetical protein